MPTACIARLPTPNAPTAPFVAAAPVGAALVLADEPVTDTVDEPFAAPDPLLAGSTAGDGDTDALLDADVDAGALPEPEPEPAEVEAGDTTRPELWPGGGTALEGSTSAPVPQGMSLPSGSVAFVGGVVLPFASAIAKRVVQSTVGDAEVVNW